jgi:hypothetical protein
VTAIHPCRPRAALPACARGIHPFQTGTGSPIDCGTWLHREDFTSHFITPAPSTTAGTSISDRASISDSVTVPAPAGKPPSPPSAPASSRPAAGNGGCSS